MLKLWQFPSCLDIAKILVQYNCVKNGTSQYHDKRLMLFDTEEGEKNPNQEQNTHKYINK